MRDLADQIATNAADFDVGKYALNAPKGKQLRIWKRTYDTVYASLITFQELSEARRVRSRAYISEN